MIESLFEEGPQSLPEAVTLEIGDTLPMGAKATFTRYAPDHIAHTRKDVWTRQNGSPAGIVRIAEVNNFNSETWFSAPPRFHRHSSPLKPETVLVDQAEIAQILPQGQEIIMINQVVQPNEITGLSEALHQVTEADFVTGRGQFGDALNPQSGTFRIFNGARTLEGLGQLAYIHFQKQAPAGPPQIPFFTEVEATYNYQHRPMIGEVIRYQLLGFTSDGKRGVISGRVAAEDGTTLALYRAKVGIMPTATMERVIAKLTATTPPAERG
jgi:hypothetical protein